MGMYNGIFWIEHSLTYFMDAPNQIKIFKIHEIAVIKHSHSLKHRNSDKKETTTKETTGNPVKDSDDHEEENNEMEDILNESY